MTCTRTANMRLNKIQQTLLTVTLIDVAACLLDYIVNVVIAGRPELFTPATTAAIATAVGFPISYFLISQRLDIIAGREALAAARDAAEHANRAKSAFLANMSHELRTPLNAILGYAELVRDGLGPEPPQSYAGTIVDAGQHLLTLIDEILDLSRIESGHMRFVEEAVDLNDSIRSVCRILDHRAVSRGINLERRAAPDLPPLRADPVRLKQILLNLCGNAIKFTPPGGTVLITTSHDQGGVLVTIADTGIGMVADDVPRALEPFGQLENGPSRKFGGTGLGLPIAKALTELHGGTLEIVTAPGRGTAIMVQFPAERILRPPET
jgi:signal transduction histidine kinase